MSAEREDDVSSGVEFACADVGVACKQVTRAANADDLVEAVAAHAQAKHKVTLNSTLVDYAVTKVRAIR